MTTNDLGSQIIEDEEKIVEEQLRETNQPVTQGDRLKLTGVEVLVFLAAKVVLPIFCGLISRVIYLKSGHIY